MKHDLPKGYTCLCGKVNPFVMYVFAHWNERLDHTCECGRKNTIVRGRLISKREDMKKSTKKGGQ